MPTAPAPDPDCTQPAAALARTGALLGLGLTGGWVVRTAWAVARSAQARGWLLGR